MVSPAPAAPKRTALLKLALALLVLAALSSAPAHAQLGAEALPDLSGVADAVARAAAPPPASGDLFRSGLEVPSVEPGATARSIGRQLREQAEAEGGPSDALAQLEASMPTLLQAVEQGLEGVGFAQRDFGVAAAYAFIYNWETATGQTIPEEPSAAAARTVATAIAGHWGASYQAMDPAAQEEAYEALVVSTTLLSAFAQQFEQADADEAAAGMRQAAGETFRALFGVPPAQVSVDAEGRITGLASGTSVKASSPDPAASAATRTPPPSAQPTASAGPLPPANAEGVEVYIKYTWGYSINGFEADQEPLILFPDGTAIEWMPRGGTPAFTPEAIRAAFEDENDRRRYVGTWHRDGDRMTITMNGKTRTLQRVPRGWYDDEDEPDPDSGRDIYFPVIEATTEHLLGPWITKSLFTSGTAGGALPMVASGSTTNRVFYADGTFSEDRESFVSATSANVGDAYSSGSSFAMFDENKGQAAGRWRIDGPLMTLGKDGERRVVLAFIMPEWSKDNPDSDIWVGRDFWERPDEGE